MIAKEEIEEALNQAIASHEDRARGGYGLGDCPLCMLSDKSCKEYCPIAKLTRIAGESPRSLVVG